MWSDKSRNPAPSYFSVFAIYFFWIACVFDPVGQVFGMKFMALGCVALVLLARFMWSDAPIHAGGAYFWSFVLLVVVLPVYGMAVALLRGGLAGPFVDTGYASSAVYIVCSLIYLRSGSLRTGVGALVVSLRLLCVVIWATLIIVITSVSNGFTEFLLQHGIAFLGAREYSGFGFFYIYFVSSPMLISLLCYEAWQFAERPSFKRGLLLLLPVSAMFLTGSRASIAIALSGVIFTWVWLRAGKTAVMSSIVALGALLAILVFLEVPVLSGMFSADEQSNSAKLAYLAGYERILDDPITFIFGQGFNAQLWSSDFALLLTNEATRTELTYLEALRVFGIWVWALWIGCMLYLALNRQIEKGDFPWIGPALFLYLCMSALNPYIFSSNGMLLIGLAAAATAAAGDAQRRLDRYVSDGAALGAR